MELLKELTQGFGPSGRENNIRDIIKSKVSQYADEVTADALGNLIVRKKGKGKKIMLAAHMDEIGIIVTFIDDNGYLRFSAVGGLNKQDILYKRVRFENGTVGVIGTEKENKDKLISKMYIDIGTESKEEAEKSVSVGDMAAFEGDYEVSGTKVISKALDNRAGCYVLIETLKRVKSDNDLYFVFTVQEEVGLRGAKTSSYAIAPDYAVAVDVTDTGDTPNAEEMAVKMGKGAAVKVMDRSVLCDGFVRTALIEAAKKNNIPYQLEVMTDGGTDAGAISVSRSGVKTGGVSIPTRYIHSPSEMADMNDIKACIDILSEFLNI